MSSPWPSSAPAPGTATLFPPYKLAAVGGLVPYARNARTHSDAQVAQIAASIREFGFTNPILVDGDRGVIAGHGRLLAARKLGMVEVPTLELSHLTPTQRRAYVLADNRLALSAGWDDAMLRLELGELQAEGFDLALTGFDELEIAGFLVEPAEGLTDPDALPTRRMCRSAGWATSGCSAATAWPAATPPRPQWSNRSWPASAPTSW